MGLVIAKKRGCPVRVSVSESGANFLIDRRVAGEWRVAKRTPSMLVVRMMLVDLLKSDSDINHLYAALGRWPEDPSEIRDEVQRRKRNKQARRDRAPGRSTGGRTRRE